MRTLYRLALLALLAAIAAGGTWAQTAKEHKKADEKKADEKADDKKADDNGAMPEPVVFTQECEPPGSGTPKDPKRAIVLIRMQNSQCSATFIKPRQPNGKWHLLTANHCLRKGQRCTVRLDDGRSVTATAVSSEERSDICWLETDQPLGPDIPALELASANPPQGAKVWHQGFGVDKPRNREEGTAQLGIDQNGQTRYFISVSPGDSGGGICDAASNKVYSPVCCTTRLAAPGWVWGGAATRAWQLRPGAGKPAEIVEMKFPARGPYVGHNSNTIVPVLILGGHRSNGH